MVCDLLHIGQKMMVYGQKVYRSILFVFTIPEKYCPCTVIDIPFTPQFNRDGVSSYLEILPNGTIKYTGMESILVNAMWLTK